MPCNLKNDSIKSFKKGLKVKVTKGEIFILIKLEMVDQKLEVEVANIT